MHDIILEFFGTYLNGEWLFYKTDTNRSFMTLLPFDLVTNLYSRNTGLLESKVMLKKKVLIAGAGSVGSFIALELATITYLFFCYKIIFIHSQGIIPCSIFPSDCEYFALVFSISNNTLIIISDSQRRKIS